MNTLFKNLNLWLLLNHCNSYCKFVNHAHGAFVKSQRRLLCWPKWHIRHLEVVHPASRSGTSGTSKWHIQIGQSAALRPSKWHFDIAIQHTSACQLAYFSLSTSLVQPVNQLTSACQLAYFSQSTSNDQQERTLMVCSE